MITLSLESLPNELKGTICSYLKPDDLSRLSRTSKAWKAFCESDFLWRECYRRDFSSTIEPEERDSKTFYKATYLHLCRKKACRLRILEINDTFETHQRKMEVLESVLQSSSLATFSLYSLVVKAPKYDLPTLKLSMMGIAVIIASLGFWLNKSEEEMRRIEREFLEEYGDIAHELGYQRHAQPPES